MKEKLIQYIQQELIDEDDIELSSSEDLLSSGLLGSLSVMKLIAYIEKEFGVTVPPSDMTVENFVNVDAMADYMENNTK